MDHDVIDGIDKSTCKDINDVVDGINTSTTTIRQRIKSPAIIACGYKQVHIDKTGNLFPAFLVALPTRESDGIDNRNTRLLVWRTKRDFLLLSRSVSLPLILPKTALKKLAENVPWIRPHEDDDGRHDQNVMNRYHPTMKKSIWQIDQYLNTIYQRITTSNSEKDQILLGSSIKVSFEKAWNIFCRPYDTVELRIIHPIPFHINQNTTTNSTVEDTPETGSLNDMFTIISTTSKQQSSNWGQYFASNENSQKVVNIMMNKLVDLCENRKNGSSNRKNQQEQYVFVEPCCGDGNILVALIQTLEQQQQQQHEILPDCVSIQGYDIDPNAIAKCQQRNEFQSSKYHKSIHWKCTNFLQTRQDFRGSIRLPGQDETIAQTNDPIVCCIGGPPYTSGPGSKNDMQRDLPIHFIKHCQKEWNADIIVFMLPIRYQDEKELMSKHGYEQWDCEAFNLESSTFYFQGIQQVTQPSIIQTFTRKK